MADIRRCPQCGAELAADAPEGLCPQCLLIHGLETQPPSDSCSVAAAASPAAQSYHGPITAPTIDELARHFPQLEIIEPLGQGGMGAVYKARQPELDRLVALKILPPDAARDPAFAERFTREARALAKLNHPNIVAVHGLGQAGGLWFIIMEYVEGVNLRQLLRSGQCKPEEALRIVPQICEALQFAHDEGIVHRDIKPENILLDKRGRVKIADFGLAKLLGHTRTDYTLTGPWQVMGTPNYMAPEQFDDPLKVDHRADIYALGVVFYEMLTGELPRGRFPPPSQKVQVDVRLDEVVLRSLEKEPERRYQQASEVKTDVEAISRGGQMWKAIPAWDPRTRPQAPTVEAAREAVKLPAVGLFVTGILDCLCSPFGSPNLVNGVADLMIRTKPVQPWVLGVVMFCHILIGLALLIGAPMMRSLRWHRFAVTISILALVPRFPLSWIIGLWMGIWALTVLRRREVQDAFRAGILPPTVARSDIVPTTTVEPDSEAAREVVKGPAIGLLVAGAFAFVSPILFTVGLIVYGVIAQGSRPAPRPMFQPFGAIALGLVNAMVIGPLAVVIMVGALSMKKLMARWLALTSSILAVLPLSVVWLVTLPLGIWSLVVLNKRTIEDAFHTQTVDRDAVQQQIRRLAVLDLYIGILAVALLAPLPIALVILFVFDPPADFSATLAGLMTVFVLLVIPSVLLIVAARKMRRLESYAWAVTASLLVMLSVIGLPIGLWSLAVLTGRGVKSVFAHPENRSRRADPDQPEQYVAAGVAGVESSSPQPSASQPTPAGVSPTRPQAPAHARLKGPAAAALVGITAFFIIFAIARYLLRQPPDFDKVGGTRLVYQLDPASRGAPFEMEQLTKVLRLRVDPTGTVGAKVAALSDDRVEILLPAVTHLKQLAIIESRITRVGLLEFRIVANQKHDQAAIAEAMEKRQRGEPPPAEYEWVQLNDPAVFQSIALSLHEEVAVQEGFVLTKVPDESMRVTTDDLERPFATQEQRSQPAVGFKFNSRGTQAFAQLTRAHRPEPDGFRYRLAIILDNIVVSSPVINAPIEDGAGMIMAGGYSGFAPDEAADLVAVLQAGRLPAKLLPNAVERETIAPRR